MTFFKSSMKSNNIKLNFKEDTIYIFLWKTSYLLPHAVEIM